jgi:glycosyltransferase involved in cell wall biosynthesis
LGLPSVSNPDFFLKIRRKFKSYLRWLKRAPEGLYVMTPFLLPFFGSTFIRRLNLFLLIWQLRLAMFLCKMRAPILWVCIPSAADVAEHLNPRLMVYQVSDKYDANEDSALSRQVIRDLDERLKRKADVVLFSGRKLFEESNLSKRCFLEQAVDFDHFATSASHTAEDIATIPHPVLCYFGAIDYVMDTPLIEEVARLKPDWHWVFIGLRSNLVDIKAPNVHFLGPKPYSDLPSYVSHADVFVLPWRQDNAFVSYGSAIKIREYLATGKPVVIAPLYEYLNTPGVRIYRTVENFIGCVEDALHRDTQTDRELRQSQVRDCTWDVRARQLGIMFSSLLQGRSAAQAIESAQLTGATEPVAS